jgi:hypothetical protein
MATSTRYAGAAGLLAEFVKELVHTALWVLHWAGGFARRASALNVHVPVLHTVLMYGWMHFVSALY